MTRQIKAEIILDSMSEVGKRITTFKLTIPRFILAQLNTHRVFSRNTSSSRAVPTVRFVEMVETQPFSPIGVKKNASGMLPSEELPPEILEKFHSEWAELGKIVAGYVRRWAEDYKIHKQHANRPLEAWLMCDVLVTSTEWDNFLNQRLNDAQPEICEVAQQIKHLLDTNKPVVRTFHIPYVSDDELKTHGMRNAAMISAGRCCRISYLRLDGTASPAEESIERAEMLLREKHWSPFEHQAIASDYYATQSLNFIGWFQFREEVMR